MGNVTVSGFSPESIVSAISRYIGRLSFKHDTSGAERTIHSCWLLERQSKSHIHKKRPLAWCWILPLRRNASVVTVNPTRSARAGRVESIAKAATGLDRSTLNRYATEMQARESSTRKNWLPKRRSRFVLNVMLGRVRYPILSLTISSLPTKSLRCRIPSVLSRVPRPLAVPVVTMLTRIRSTRTHP